MRGRTRFIVVIVREDLKTPKVIDFESVLDFRDWYFDNVSSLRKSAPYQGTLRDGSWFMATRGKAVEMLETGRVSLL